MQDKCLDALERVERVLFYGNHPPLLNKLKAHVNYVTYPLHVQAFAMFWHDLNHVEEVMIATCTIEKTSIISRTSQSTVLNLVSYEVFKLRV